MAKSTKEDYSVTMRVGDNDHSAKAPTIIEAFKKLDLGQMVWAGKVFITIARGGRSHQFFLPPLQARKLKNSENYQLIFEKRAKLFLGEIL